MAKEKEEKEEREIITDALQPSQLKNLKGEVSESQSTESIYLYESCTPCMSFINYSEEIPILYTPEAHFSSLPATTSTIPYLQLPMAG